LIEYYGMGRDAILAAVHDVFGDARAGKQG
jgi:hypothetical protein